MSIVYTRGDLLLNDSADALVNTVNCVGVMGKGIALDFKKKYPGNFTEYRQACQMRQIIPGRMFIHSTGLTQPRYIINFPTKDYWRNPSRIDYVKNGLVDLINQIKQLGITSVAIPPLGCANGGLKWMDVKPLIEEACAEIPEVQVQAYEPRITLLNKHRDVIPPDAIFIGRGAPLGNRFEIGKHGTRLEVIDMYRQWLRDKILDRDSRVLAALETIRSDSKLLCYCAPAPCHGRVIADYWTELNEYPTFREGLEAFIKKYTPGRPLQAIHDGLRHINIYSKGKTELGRLLSNLDYSPIVHPEYGKFASVEGFWYWLATGRKHDELRSLYGFEAKKHGCKLKVIKAPDFHEQIRVMLELKVQQHKHIKDLLIKSELPFEHYYYYGLPDNCKVILPNSRDWIIQQFEEIRQQLKSVGFKLIIAGSRDITDYALVKEAYYNSDFQATEIVSGAAKRGVDPLGERLSEEILGKKATLFEADWDGPLKKGAGFARNVQMADYADGLLAIWDTRSPGTKHMIETARQKGLVIKVIYVS